jgi:hypothetical protein
MDRCKHGKTGKRADGDIDRCKFVHQCPYGVNHESELNLEDRLCLFDHVEKVMVSSDTLCFLMTSKMHDDRAVPVDNGKGRGRGRSESGRGRGRGRDESGKGKGKGHLESDNPKTQARPTATVEDFYAFLDDRELESLEESGQVNTCVASLADFGQKFCPRDGKKMTETALEFGMVLFSDRKGTVEWKSGPAFYSRK